MIVTVVPTPTSLSISRVPRCSEMDAATLASPIPDPPSHVERPLTFAGVPGRVRHEHARHRPAMLAGLDREAEVPVLAAQILLEQVEIAAQGRHGRDQVVGEGALQRDLLILGALLAADVTHDLLLSSAVYPLSVSAPAFQPRTMPSGSSLTMAKRATCSSHASRASARVLMIARPVQWVCGPSREAVGWWTRRERMPVLADPMSSPRRIATVRGSEHRETPSTARTRLTTDAAALGLRTVRVPTAVGVVSVRVGDRRGPVATVFLHGAAGSWTTWTPLLGEAARSGAPLPDVVAFDLPGWGESESPRDGVDIVRTTTAVLEVIERLGYRRSVVVGHSLGGALALDLAARAPEMTDGVVLVSPSGAAAFDAVRRPIRGGLRLPGLAGMLLAMRFLRTLGGAAAGFLRRLERAGLLRVLSSPLFAAPRDIDPSVIRALAAEIRPAAFVAAARAAAAYDESSWRGIHCPVRAVQGDRDVFVGEGDAAALSAAIVDFRETTLDGVGHFAAIERPAAVLALMRRVVADVSARRPR